MSYLTGRSSFDPFLILAIVVAGCREAGLWPRSGVLAELRAQPPSSPDAGP